MAKKINSSYQNYLKSSHWQRVREIVRAEHGGECFYCGAAAPNGECHHLYYENGHNQVIGQETIITVEDRQRVLECVWLCTGCHKALHKKIPTYERYINEAILIDNIVGWCPCCGEKKSDGNSNNLGHKTINDLSTPK